jgi:alpha-tubulin suppressor-like RCC1 family protein
MNEIVSAWGDNSNGNLGIGDADGRNAPTVVTGLEGVRTIEAGSGHVIALLEDGTAYGWGRNAFGQVGNASTENATSPQRVKLDGIKSVAPGGGHTLFLREDGTVWGCGAGFFGMLGPDNMRVHPVPVPVPAPEGIVSLVSGGSHALALLEDGSVWSWGRDDRGQLGDGEEAGTRPGHVVQAHAGVEFVVRNLPAQVKGISDARHVAVGGGHSLVVHADGTLSGWGFNDCGQLGDGTTENKNAPFKLPVEGVRETAGAYHHTLILLEDGTVQAIGLNDCGQLGNGGTTNSLTPVEVKGLRGVTQVAATGGGGDTNPGGFGHSLAVLDDGTLWAWGCNNSGELGLGSNDGQIVPVQVPGLAGVRYVTVGGDVPFVRENPGGGSATAIHTAQA